LISVEKYTKQGCPPCNQLSNFIERDPVLSLLDIKEIAIEDVGRDVFVAKKIRSVPTIIVYDESGEELGRVMGYHPDSLIDLLESAGSYK
jgi:glutaredoxin